MSRIDELETRVANLEAAVFGGAPLAYRAGRPQHAPNAPWTTTSGLHEGQGGVGVSVR